MSAFLNIAKPAAVMEAFAPAMPVATFAPHHVLPEASTWNELAVDVSGISSAVADISPFTVSVAADASHQR